MAALKGEQSTIEFAGDPGNEIYTTRKSVLAPQKTWRLTPHALVRESREQPLSSSSRKLVETLWRILLPWASPLTDDSWPDAAPFEEIVCIRTRFDPTRFDFKRERCDLVDAQGRRTSLFSTRYVSVGNFEDQSQSYTPFVAELTRRVMAAHPRVRVCSGLSWPAYLLQHGLVLVALLALASMLSVAGLPLVGTIWAKLIIAFSYSSVLWSYARRNRPRRINPPRD
ncbi:MAG: hypothetical protein K2Y29_08060 [Beijerinckiaceae bacterium]|nr:hypothetical protein [Beijerinckiaceae bacterium]